MRPNDVHIDALVPEWIADHLIAELTEQSVRRHNVAAQMNEKEQGPLRRDADSLSQAAHDIWNARHGKIVPIRNSGTITDQRHGTGNNSLHISDRAGLYVAILALAVALFALGKFSQMSELMDAKVQAGMAQASKDMQAEVARANAVAHTAETHARVALDKVETAETELGKKGINIRTDGH